LLAFIGKTVAILIWVATSINFFNSSGNALRYFVSIFPNWGLVFAINVMFQYERSSVSLTFGQLYNSIFSDTLTVGGVLTAQILWTLFYIPVAWYIERIFPGEYGAPQPFYFPFMVCIKMPIFKVF
jgi:ATP-binding cassette subfamily A (ABC1) protein 3